MFWLTSYCSFLLLNWVHLTEIDESKMTFCETNPEVYFCSKEVGEVPNGNTCGFGLENVIANFDDKQIEEILKLINDFRVEFAEGKLTNGMQIGDVRRIVSSVELY